MEAVVVAATEEVVVACRGANRLPKKDADTDADAVRVRRRAEVFMVNWF